MPIYLSVTILFLICVYFISHSIYLFNKGKYNPYIFRKSTNERKLVNFLLNILVVFFSNILLYNLQPSSNTILVSMIVISSCFTLYVSILNYLSYLKIRDRKIIYQTVILNILIIGFCTFMINYNYIHNPISNSEIYQKYEKDQLDQIQQITIEDLSLDGNTQSNTNNYGLVAETKDSLFYINDNAICRADKDFTNQLVIFDQDSGIGKDSINVVGDWVFFRQGKEIKRMKNDGGSVDRIFSGYSIQMHVVGNWIYFRNLSDDSKIYKMDVNGQKREILFNQEGRDMTVYDGKIYYSYEDNDEGHLEVMNVDGTGKQLLLNIKARNMVVDEDYIYYLNYEDEKLYRVKLTNNSIEKLSNQKILKFCKDDHWIFYTLKAPEYPNRRFKGLYRMGVDGGNVLALDSESYLNEVGMGITEEWVFYVSSNGTNRPTLNRLKKDGRGTKIE